MKNIKLVILIVIGLSWSSLACNSTQIGRFKGALRTAQNSVRSAQGRINANSSQYRRWFGQPNQQRLRLVRNNFRKILNALGRVKPDCECDSFGDSFAYAYVDPTKPYKVFICDEFFNQNYRTRSEVLIHEVSHFNSVARTDDYTPGSLSQARSLARSNPDKAVRNAYSYGGFGAGL